MSKTMINALRGAFEYRFAIGEVDGDYLWRVATAVRERDGAVVASDRSSLTLRVSIAKLSKHKIVSILAPSLLIKNLIMITVDSENQAVVEIRDPIRKLLYRSLFLVFSIVLASILASRQEYLQLVEAVPIVILLYLIASRLPPMAEYARLRNFLFEQKE